MVQDTKATRGGVQGQSESGQHDVAHHRCGKDARLTQGGNQEHNASSGHEIRGPSGTCSGDVSMTDERQCQGAGKREGVRGRCLPSPPGFVKTLFSMYFGFLSR